MSSCCGGAKKHVPYGGGGAVKAFTTKAPVEYTKGAQLHFFAHLIAAQVVITVPAEPTDRCEPADTDCCQSACGRIWLWFAPDFSSVKYELQVYNGVNVQTAHLFDGRAGTNGVPIAQLFDAGCCGPIDVNGCLSEGVLYNCDLLANAEATPPPCGQAPINIAALYQLVRENYVYTAVASGDEPPDELVRGQVFSA